MTDEQGRHKDFTAVQHPVILRTAIPEGIVNLLVLAVIVGILQWADVGFEITLFALLIVGFALNAMNVAATGMAQNVHLTEIRDELLRQGRQTRSQPRSFSN